MVFWFLDLVGFSHLLVRMERYFKFSLSHSSWPDHWFPKGGIEMCIVRVMGMHIAETTTSSPIQSQLVPAELWGGSSSLLWCSELNLSLLLTRPGTWEGPSPDGLLHSVLSIAVLYSPADGGEGFGMQVGCWLVLSCCSFSSGFCETSYEAIYLEL